MKKFLVVVLVVLLGACTHVDPIEHVKKQTVVFRTPHVTGAKCELIDKRGTKWRVKKTPSVVTLRGGNAPLNVICQKPGYRKNITVVQEERVDFRNYPGFLEEVVGFVQDPFSNIATRYPDEIVIWMEPLEWASEEAMREWYYDKNIYEKQQEAKRIAREEEERRLREMEIEMRSKYANRLKRQRQRLYNSKWFNWLADNQQSRRDQTMYDLEKRIEKAKDKANQEPEPINWRQEQYHKDEEEPKQKSFWKFWQSDWFEKGKAWSKKPRKRYPNSKQ